MIAKITASKKLTIGITGADGYVGSHIAKELAKKHTIIKLSRQQGKDRLQYDLSSKKIPDLSALDILLHCAHDFSAVRKKDIEEINLQGSLRLLRAAKRAGVRTIFISSLAAYEGCKSIYGQTKLKIEQSGLADVIIRPGLVYGGADKGIFGKLANIARHIPVMPIISKTDQASYLCHVSDLTNTVDTCIHIRIRKQSPEKNTTLISAASETPVQLRDMLETAAGKRLRFIIVPYWLALSALRTLEFLRLPAPFRSDGLIGLAHINRKPDFRATRKLRLPFREFRITQFK